MPSSFTAPVESGEIERFEDFALLCARGIDYLYSLRDTPLSFPLPEKMYPDQYHKKQLDAVKRRLAKLQSMTKDEVVKAAEKDRAEEMKRVAECNEADEDRRERFLKMKGKVERWQPPTETHDNFRIFMLEQLEQDLRYLGKPLTPEPKLTPAAWKKREIEQAKRDIEYHGEHWEAEKLRVAEANKWLAALRKSLREFEREEVANGR